MLERLALSRVEIVSELYADLGLTSSSASHAPSNLANLSNGFTAEDIIVFTVHALEHRVNEAGPFFYQSSLLIPR